MDDLLREAVAIQNQLEKQHLKFKDKAEKFTPRLQSMLSKKIQSEMEDSDETEDADEMRDSEKVCTTKKRVCTTKKKQKILKK